MNVDSDDKIIEELHRDKAKRGDKTDVPSNLIGQDTSHENEIRVAWLNAGQRRLAQALIALPRHKFDEGKFDYLGQLVMLFCGVPEEILFAVAEHLDEQREDGLIREQPRLDALWAMCFAAERTTEIELIALRARRRAELERRARKALTERAKAELQRRKLPHRRSTKAK